MNDSSKIGREQRGEKEDKGMQERESIGRREGSPGIEVERGKRITVSSGEMERKWKRKGNRKGVRERDRVM